MPDTVVPTLMLLGAIPCIPHHDFGWLTLSAPPAGGAPNINCAGFAGYPKDRRTWWN